MNLLPTQTKYELTFFTKIKTHTWLRKIQCSYCTEYACPSLQKTGRKRFRFFLASYDSCISTSHLSLSFVDTATGLGMNIESSQAYTNYIYDDATAENKRGDIRDVYFMTRRCSDATCTTYPDSEGAYVSSVTVSDGWATDTTYGTTATSLNSLSKIPMYVFKDGTDHHSHCGKLTLVAAKPGTYTINAFIKYC